MIRIRLLSLYDRNDGNKYTISSLRLASYVCNLNEIEARILTLPMDYSENEMDTLLNRINEEDIDVLGLSAYIWTWSTIKKISLNVKRKKKLRIVVGGPEVINRNTHDWFGDEIFVYGEGEMFFREICKFAIQGKTAKEILNMSIIGNSIKEGKRYIVAKEGSLNYEQCAYSAETFNQLYIKDFSIEYAYYETTRGCPYKCGYCGHKFRSKIAAFDDDFLKKEISFFGSIGMKELFIIDPIIGGTQEHGKKVFSLFQELSPQTKIVAYLRPEYLDVEYIDILQKSNISELRLGVQTINKKVPKWIRNNNIGKILDVLPRLSKIGIPWRAELIVGLPGDNMNGLRETFRFLINEVKPTFIHAYHLTVLKETELYRLVNAPTHWIRMDKKSFRALESYSYSEDELKKMIIYSVLITSFYNYFASELQEKAGKYYNYAPNFEIITNKVEEQMAYFQITSFPQYEDGVAFWKKIIKK